MAGRGHDGAAAVIPRPNLVRISGDSARLDRGSVVTTDAGSRDVAELFRSELTASTGWALPVQAEGWIPATASSPSAPTSAGVSLRVDRSAFPGGASGDAYRLLVDGSGVQIVGASASGVFYGTRTLALLLPADLLRRAPQPDWADEIDLVGVLVDDEPRFAWRGFHLDVARHFLPKTWILRLIDLLALHKLNVLHLHLTDDQGWRVPIDAYPRLVEIGAWRRESMDGHHRDGRYDGIPHGGYYSKADLREIVSYAARRFVTVMPEIDMPGHMQAAIAAYPELGNGTEPLEVFTSWGISDHVLNLEEPTIGFCTDVLGEVCDLFPSSCVHVGGDECPTVEWEQSPHARNLKAELGVADDRALQGWFTQRMARFLTENGRRLMGWDELLDGGAPPGSLVTAWRHPRYGTQAAQAGHDVVMAPMVFLYFDWANATGPAEPLAIAEAITTERVYSYEPVPRRLEPAHQSHILGAQCQLWTEYIRTPAHAEYMSFPRACAFSEVVWSSADRDWEEFSQRLEQHLPRLAALGVNYRPLDGPTPGQSPVWAGTPTSGSPSA